MYIINQYKTQNILRNSKKLHTNLPQDVGVPCSVPSFKGNPVKAEPFLETTFNDVKSLYQKYHESLNEMSFQDIKKTTQNLTEETGHSRKEVLTAMQKLTQFASFRSITDIAEAMKKHDISYIGSACHIVEANLTDRVIFGHKEVKDAVLDTTGLNKLISYLFTRKGFAQLKPQGTVNAFFLDNQKITALEKLKESHPQIFEQFKQIPNLKFFMISGWDSGINFANRSKDLATETKKLLEYSDKTGMSIEDAIDNKIKKRIKTLGISPVVISKEGYASETCIYRQMSPDRMTEGEWFNLIDANSQVRSEDPIEQIKIKDTATKYLANNLTVYTPERLSLAAKDLHGNIVDFAAERGIKPKDIIYLEPQSEKSYSMINYIYKQTNDIPDNQFINVTDILYNREKLNEQQMVVILDDCTLSGDSLRTSSAEITKLVGKRTPKVFAFICGTDTSIKHFSTKHDKTLMVGEIVNTVPTKNFHLVNKKLEGAIGNSDYPSNGATCITFPYMSPDNNTAIASNIALLHNPLYRKENMLKIAFFKRNGIKHYNLTIDTIAKRSNKLTGTTPTYTTERIIEPKKPLKERFKELIHYDYFKELKDELNYLIFGC